MRIRTEPTEIWNEYQRAVTYNNSIDLYTTVERNENFYNDKQWEGLNAPDIDKPVFNFLKPVVNFYVSQLVSDDIAVNIDHMQGYESEEAEPIEKAISKEVDSVIERCNLKFLNRRIIKNCAIDGDACLFFYFDPDTEVQKGVFGEICAEVIDNTNVMFGNPTDERVEAQPYIIIAYRKLVSDVQEEYEKNGGDPADIVADDGMDYLINVNNDIDNNYCTVLLKLWKEKDSIWFSKTTQNVVIKEPTNTEYSRYPLAYISWEYAKNSYHGISPMTGKIQNQIFVNKLYAMAMEYTKKMAFPKILYDRTKIPGGWNNQVGKAVAVTGNPQEAIFSNFAPAGLNGSVTEMIGITINQTKEMMGAYDAALGNVRPDNTSAIVATQKAAAAPLDVQRLDFYNFIENYIRIIIDMMRVNYGVRKLTINIDGREQTMPFDWSTIRESAMNLNIEVGASSYWSEITQIATLDNLMAMKIIPSAKLYLEAIPDGYIKNKQKIIDGIEEIEGMQQQMLTQEPTANMMPQEMPIEQGAEPQTAQGDEILALASEIADLSPEAQAQAIEALNVPEDVKNEITAAVMAVKEDKQNVM